MIESIKWKVKTSADDSLHPKIKYIRVKILLSKQAGTEYWCSWLDGQLENDVMTLSSQDGLYKYVEYCEYNPVTLATLLYLEQLQSIHPQDVNTRSTWHTQVMKSIETLHAFWD